MLTPIFSHGTYANTLEAIADGRIRYPAYCWLTDVEEYGFLNSNNELETIGIPCFEGAQDAPIVLSDLQDGIYQVKGYQKISPSDITTLNNDSYIFVIIETENEVQKIRRITADDLSTYTVQNDTVTNVDATVTESYLDLHEYVTQDVVDEKMDKIPSPTGNKLVISDVNGDIVESNYTTDSFVAGNFTTPQDGQIVVYSNGNIENSTYTVSDLGIDLVDASVPTTGYLKTYELYQGNTLIGKIDIPKDLVVTSGEVVTNPTGQPAGTYIKLVIANQVEPVYINVADLVSTGIIVDVKVNGTSVVDNNYVAQIKSYKEVTQAQYDALFPPGTTPNDGILYAIKDAEGGGGGTDEKVKQSPVSTNAEYRILFSKSADDVERTETVGKNGNLIYNPSENHLNLIKNLTETLDEVAIAPTGFSVLHRIKEGTVDTRINIEPTDIRLNGSTWDGTNASLKTAIANAGGGGDTKVTQTITGSTSTENNAYSILFSETTGNTTKTEGARKNSGLKFNPYSGRIFITSSSSGAGYEVSTSTYDYNAYFEAEKSAIIYDDNNGTRRLVESYVSPSSQYILVEGTFNGSQNGLKIINSDIELQGTNNTWDGTNTSLKMALSTASGKVEQIISDTSTVHDEYFDVLFGDTPYNKTMDDTETSNARKSIGLRYNPHYQRLVVSSVANYDISGDYLDAYALPCVRVVYRPPLDNIKECMLEYNDVELVGNTWDGTNVSLKAALASLSSRITALGG